MSVTEPPHSDASSALVDQPDVARAGGNVDLPEPAEASPRSRRFTRTLVEWGVIVVVVLAATVLLRTFVVQSYYIPSGSMLPTLQVGDRIIVDKLSYRFSDPKRGDIVVFSRPPLEGQAYPDLVKRVVGLPGETISSSGGRLTIDGKVLNEPWLPPGPQAYTTSLQEVDPHPRFDLPGPVKIPPGEYYVMGDNRTDSEDSRFFGPIRKSLIVGRAVAVVWPFGQMKGL